MATNPYTSVSISGYNTNPPPDDGTTGAANQLKWSKHKDKIGDPLKNLAESIDTNVLAAFAKTINTDPDQSNAIAGSIALTSSELTISGGSVTVVRSHHTIDTESDASSDDLATIVNSGAVDGTVLYLRAATATRVVTLQSGVGNIFLRSGNKVLQIAHPIQLIRVGTNWHEVETEIKPDTIAELTGVLKSTLINGLTVFVAGYTVANDGGGGWFTWDASNTNTEDLGVTFEADEGGTGRWVRNFTGPVDVRWFGAVVGQVSHTECQSALDYVLDLTTKSKVLDVSSGKFIVDETLKITTSGKGPIKISCGNKYLAGFQAGPLLAAVVPTALGGTHNPTPDFPPILQLNNTTGVTFDELGLFGEDEDVYGLYCNESFFLGLDGVRVTGTNQRPYTFIRVQLDTFKGIAAFLCGQGGVGFDGSTLFYNTSTLSIISPNFERIGTPRYSLEIFQPNNKGGWIISNPWFEQQSVGVGGNISALGMLSVGGRRGKVLSPFQSSGDHVFASDTINLKASTDTLSTDNITMTTNAALGWEIEVNDVSATTRGISIGVDAAANDITGNLDATKVVNNAPASKGNRITPLTMADATSPRNFNGGFRVGKSPTATGVDIGATDYILEVTDESGTELIKMLGNDNNNFSLNGANLELTSNASMGFVSGAAFNYTPASGSDYNMFFAGGGTLLLSGIPTATGGLSAGQVWSNAGVLTLA